MSEKKTIANLSIRLGIDKVDFTGLDKAMRSLDKAGRKMQTYGKNMSMYMTAPILAAGVAMTKTAIDAEETSSKFQTVFQDVSKEAQAASLNLQDNYGMSKQSAEDMLSMTGDLVTGMGMESGAAIDLSQKINQLAVDLASFTNYQGGAKGASEALTKAMLGEREQAKMLGLVIQENGISAKLAEKGQEKLAGQALLQAKAYATLEIALEQSKNAQGDYNRTQDSAANMLRQNQEAAKDMAAAFGAELLPITKELLASGKDVLKWLNQLSPETKKNILVFGGLAAATGPVIGGLGSILTTLPKVTKAVKAMNVAVKANPWILAASLVAAGGTALFAYIKKTKNAKTAQEELNESLSETNDLFASQNEILLKYNFDANSSSIDDLIKKKSQLEEKLNIQRSGIADFGSIFGEEYVAKMEKAIQSTLDYIGAIDGVIVKKQMLHGVLSDENQGVEDLVEAKRQEIELAEKMPGRTLDEVAARNLHAAILKEELRALEALGLERHKQLMAPMESIVSQVTGNIDDAPVPNLAPAAQAWTDFSNHYQSEAMRIEQMSQELSAEIHNSAVGITSDFIQMSVEAVASGQGFQGAFLGLLEGLANVAIRVGVIVVATSKAVQGFRDSLTKLQPELGLIHGLGLIAVGTAAKFAITNSVPQYANGTSWHPGGLAIVGERGPELVNLPTGAAVTPNRMMGLASGGKMEIVISGQFVQRGSDMVATVRKVLKSDIMMGSSGLI